MRQHYSLLTIGLHSGSLSDLQTSKDIKGDIGELEIVAVVSNRNRVNSVQLVIAWIDFILLSRVATIRKQHLINKIRYVTAVFAYTKQQESGDVRQKRGFSHKNGQTKADSRSTCT